MSDFCDYCDGIGTVIDESTDKAIEVEIPCPVCSIYRNVKQGSVDCLGG